ncbi:oligoendopeptidase F [Tumebacillus flagellatus]|uniref:Oligopeptidase F n=1 Tax=Tumebacillus flagellatus TaxID=1157490 RepID=A0A074LVD4_9BACL|nr:oligoendopeptidase F [Tumebacillus flagellatus]KEO83948.1 oligopeptidase PepB [Tumebacillus flagellatus]
MSTTASMKRSEIGDEFKWDLGSMYESDAQWESDIKKAQELFPKMEAFKGRLGESADTLLQALELNDELETIVGNVSTYAHMRSHEDTANTHYQGLADRSNSLAAQASSAVSFLDPEILSLSEETVKSFLAENEGLRLYEIMLDRIMRRKAHVLSEEQEDLLARASEVLDSSGTIFSMLTNADMKWGQVEDSEGNLHDVSEGNYRVLMENKDRVLRENAFKRLFGTYGEFRNTLSASYSANVKKGVFYAKARNYNSTLEMELAPDNVSVDVYNNLIKAVRDNHDAMHRYMALRKKVLKLDELRYFDLFLPMVESVDMKMPYEKAKGISLEALAPLGEEYVETVKRAFADKWIDIYPNLGKRSGAYSWGTYTSNPYILLNYTDTLDDLFTLVHELGHSLHSYYTHQTQPFTYGNYTIFVAEVASTLNENLLLEKLLEETTDKNERAYLLNHSLEQFRGTMFRQTMFAEFEKFAHEKVEAGEPLTADLMRDFYGQLNADYYGPELVLDDELKNEWSRIPHFYNAFYVYKYATGFAAAMALSKQIRSEGAPAVERYLNFLRGGSSQDPIDLLKGAGVDMSSPQPIVEALSVFRERLEELEKLLNE